MKHQPFHKRLRYAIRGVFAAYESEASFRIQSALAAVAALLLLLLRPAPIWWAAIAITVAGVLSAELFNTALESLADQIHPEKHPMIGKAKDCAAGAVWVFSLASVTVAIALIWDCLGKA